jgi:putative ABC transport system ATP-binding protein
MPFPGATLLELREVSLAAGPDAPRCEITLEFAPGTFTVLRGDAGSGSRELLRALSLLEPPPSGRVLVEGEPADDWPEERRAEYRTRRFGFLLTAPFLLPSLTVLENVAMPIFKKQLPGITPQEAGERARALLDFVGVSALAEIVAGELHPLEQHRVALARALVNEPAVIFAEDLDASLPAEAVAEIFARLWHFATENAVAVIATTSPQFVPLPGLRVINVEHGLLRAEEASASLPLN